MSQEPRVIRLAEDIARNQAHLAPDQAAAVIANHLRSFWDPRMRRELIALVNGDRSSVSPVVAQAVSDLERMTA